MNYSREVEDPARRVAISGVVRCGKRCINLENVPHSMSRTITWLHLSDLHARQRDDWDAHRITETLVEDLRRLQREAQLRPDLVFFSGDGVFGAANGEKLPDQFQLVRAFFDRVRGAFDPEIPVRDLYVVPGNHDVDRFEVSPGETEWLRNPERRLQDVLAVMRDNTKQWRAWMDRLGAYRNFLTSYGLLHLVPDDPHLIWADAREISGIRVGIAGFNSAWSCATKVEKGKLWCGGEWQLSQLKQRLGPVTFSFAIIHHPGNWFSDQEDPSFMRRLRQEFPLLLHGHEHLEWVEVDLDGHAILSSAACYNSSWMPNGYNLAQIDLDKGTGRVWLRQWDNAGGGWVARNIAGKTDNGVWPLKNLTWTNQPSIEVDTQVLETHRSGGSVDNEVSADEHFTRRFCEHVIDQHDVLELFGCDIPRELQRHQLSVAYVSLNLSSEDDEQTAAPRRGGRAKPHGTEEAKATEDEGAIESTGAGIEYVLDDVSAGTGRLMIRGPAGAGKSTLLRWCAIHAAQQVLSGTPILANASRIAKDPDLLKAWNEFKDANAPDIPASWRWKIPILIRLRDCPDGRLPAANDLPKFLAKHLPSPPADWMTSILDLGRALVLLDGVDEVHRDQRPQLAEEIGELLQTYPDCTYVITTRPGAVARGWLERLNFTEARVEPMNRADQQEFIDKWYRSASLELRHRPRPGEDLAVTAQRLKGELLDQPELGVLASNPLLCAMICALYRERQERLPESPAELCEALIQMLLHRRERETPGLQSAHFSSSWRALQYPQKKGLLAELAWRMVAAGESSIDLDVAGATVREVMGSTPGRTEAEASDVLQALIERSGLLRLASDERIDFLHNTLKEYLAATRIVEGGAWEGLVEHADDAAWQPVILFCLALAPESFSSGIVRQLLERVPPPTAKPSRRPGPLRKRERKVLTETNARDFFLVRCRAAAKRLAADLSDKIDALTARLFPPVYMQEAEALAQLGPRILLHAPSLFESKWWGRQDARTAARCLRLLRLIGGSRAATAVEIIKRLPSHSSYLTGEWMLAASELCDSKLKWPFSETTVWASNTRVSDLRPLTQVTGLRDLNLSFTQVSDLRAISEKTSLQRLNLHGSRVTDLSPISACPSLKSLNLIGTRVSDLAPLRHLSALETVLLDATRVSDVTVLGELGTLRRIDLDGTAVADVSALANLQLLEVLYLRRTKVTNIRCLVSCRSLKFIHLHGTNISAYERDRFLNCRNDVDLAL
jgi:hypothetical protein